MFGFGVDVSSNQGSISWPSFANAGVQFAIVRTFIGSHEDDQTVETNDQFDSNWRTYYYGAHNAGIYVQPYMLSYAWQSMTRTLREADDVIYWYSNNALPGVRKVCWWDIEAQDIASKWGSAASILEKMQAIKAKLDAAGIEMGIYTSYSPWNTYFTDPWYETSGVHKWVAIYPDNESENPAYNNVIENWRNGNWAIHQYSSKGRINGCSNRVDLDMATSNAIFVDEGEDGDDYAVVPDEWDETFPEDYSLDDLRGPVSFLGDSSLDGMINSTDLFHRDVYKYRIDRNEPADYEIYHGVSPYVERYDYGLSPTRDEIIQHISGRSSLIGSMLCPLETYEIE